MILIIILNDLGLIDKYHSDDSVRLLTFTL